MSQRPLGVTIVALLLIAAGGLSLLAVMGIAVFSGVAGRLIAPLTATSILGLINLVLGIGLRQLRAWARVVLLAMLGLSLVSGAFIIASGGGLFGTFLAMILWGVLLWYLFRPTIREKFR